MKGDRVGIGWRPELAIQMHRYADRIDVLEFIADPWLQKPAADWETLKAWKKVCPIHLHGVGLGLASSAPLDEARLKAWARLVAAVEPEQWSEHAAFVRGGGIELGHLAAVPRTVRSAGATIANIRRAAQIVGRPPLVENIATLMRPPASEMEERDWLTAISEGAHADLLLDLHNLYANAVNEGRSALATVEALPLHRVAAIHLAGGRCWRGRILDDHLHAVPEDVWALFAAVVARCEQPLDVIVEWDGNYPSMTDLLAEVDRARAMLDVDRGRQAKRSQAMSSVLEAQPDADDIAFEALLARALTDASTRRMLIEEKGDPRFQDRLANLDREGLELAADSLAAKRQRMALAR
jgi:uncharacterized protein (UPF0276 family)